MKDRRRRKNRRNFCKIAIHTVPTLYEFSVPQMETLINGSLTEAFLPESIYVSETPDARDNRVPPDPDWHAEYRELSASEAALRYNRRLPITNQYQLDSAALVSCLKVKEPINFKQVLYYESETDYGIETGQADTSNVWALFFAMVTEKEAPVIRSWDDIPWDKTGVLEQETFYRFVQILLRRLEPILSKKWKTEEGVFLATGYNQDIVRGTYFDLIYAWAQKNLRDDTRRSPEGFVLTSIRNLRSLLN